MSKTLQANSRVLWVDDDRPYGGGWFVTLRQGWAFDDAAQPGDDPEGRTACHCHGFDTVAEALERIRRANPCHCGRCVGEPLE